MGVGCAGLDAGEPREQLCDESCREGGRTPDQASRGRQTGAAVHARTVHCEGTQSGPTPEESRRHGGTSLATAPDGPTHRVSQTPERVGTSNALARSSSLDGERRGQVAVGIDLREQLIRLLFDGCDCVSACNPPQRRCSWSTIVSRALRAWRDRWSACRSSLPRRAGSWRCARRSPRSTGRRRRWTPS